MSTASERPSWPAGSGTLGPRPSPFVNHVASIVLCSSFLGKLGGSGRRFFLGPPPRQERVAWPRNGPGGGSARTRGWAAPRAWPVTLPKLEAVQAPRLEYDRSQHCPRHDDVDEDAEDGA